MNIFLILRKLFRQKEKADNLVEDPLISSILNSYNLVLDDLEKQNIENECKTLSSLRGIVVKSGSDMHKAACIPLIHNGLFSAARLSIIQGDYNSAIGHLLKAKSLLKWPTILYALGFSYKSLKDYKNAKDYFKQALETYDTRENLLIELMPSFSKEMVMAARDILDLEVLGYKEIGLIAMSFDKDALQEAVIEIESLLK
ncbi:MAG: hypothetical protein CMQ15_15500 [Gammaproteobacteria bacterium]|nr:hypothetical protein [Gammaproteobacteria bacterium]